MTGALKAAGLRFAVSCNLSDQVENVNLKPEAELLLAEISKPLERESVRDYLVNRSFRRDLFVNGAPALDPVERWERLLAVRVFLLKPPAAVALRRQFPAGECELRPEIYRPLLDELAGAARTLGELVACRALQGIGAAQLLEAVILLTAYGDTGVATGLDPDVDHEERWRRAARFNNVALDRARSDVDMHWLVSPTMAGGVSTHIMDRLFLLALRRGEEPAAFAHQSLWRTNWRLRKSDGTGFEDEGEMLQEARRQWQVVEREQLPVWRQLGVA